MATRRITPSSPKPARPPRAADPKRELAIVLGRYIGIAIVVIAFALIAHYCQLGDNASFTPDDRVIAVDGDTLKAQDTEYRLYGIDAPELHQSCFDANGKEWACGRVAQTRLKALVAKKDVDCEARARDRYDRVVAICGTDEVPDFGETLVREGFAINLGGRGEGPYVDAEIDAQAAKRGIWRGEFQRPSEWRQAHPRDAGD